MICRVGEGRIKTVMLKKKDSHVDAGEPLPEVRTPGGGEGFSRIKKNPLCKLSLPGEF